MVYSENRNYYSFWNLEPWAHRGITSLLTVALAEAHRHHWLPTLVSASTGTRSTFGVEPLLGVVPLGVEPTLPTPEEVSLVTDTLRAILDVQALPSSAAPLVYTVLEDVLHVLREYCAESGGDNPLNGVWQDTSAEVCIVYGLYQPCFYYQDAIEQLKKRATQYFEFTAPIAEEDAPS